jgi:hypothetical protein
MEREVVDQTRWSDLPIVCPYCGNHGQEDGPWTVNAWTPFKLVEQVTRSWVFSAEIDGEGNLFLRGDSNSDDVDWESGRGMRFECMQCFGEFPLPASATVEID